MVENRRRASIPYSLVCSNPSPNSHRLVVNKALAEILGSLLQSLV